MNIVETCINVLYLYFAHIADWPAAPLVGFAAAILTLAKTILYLLQEYFCGFCAVGHNSAGRLLLYYIIPNGYVFLPSRPIQPIKGASRLTANRLAFGLFSQLLSPTSLDRIWSICSRLQASERRRVAMAKRCSSHLQLPMVNYIHCHNLVPRIALRPSSHVWQALSKGQVSMNE